jgi:hypothetical protein
MKLKPQITLHKTAQIMAFTELFFIRLPPKRYYCYYRGKLSFVKHKKGKRAALAALFILVDQLGFADLGEVIA